MSPEAFRKSLGLTQGELAHALGLRSRASINMIETGTRPASLEVALKYEKLSQGKVRAVSICPKAAEIEAVAPPEDTPPPELTS